MLIKGDYVLRGLRVDETVSMFKYWNEYFLHEIADKWETVAVDVMSPSTVVNMEDTFIHAHPGTLKTRTSRNPIAGWVRIVSCDRERFIEDLSGVI